MPTQNLMSILIWPWYIDCSPYQESGITIQTPPNTLCKNRSHRFRDQKRRPAATAPCPRNSDQRLESEAAVSPTPNYNGNPKEVRNIVLTESWLGLKSELQFKDDLQHVLRVEVRMRIDMRFTAHSHMKGI